MLSKKVVGHPTHSFSFLKPPHYQLTGEVDLRLQYLTSLLVGCSINSFILAKPDAIVLDAQQ
jgi:hypothetical protein